MLPGLSSVCGLDPIRGHKEKNIGSGIVGLTSLMLLSDQVRRDRADSKSDTEKYVC